MMVAHIKLKQILLSPFLVVALVTSVLVFAGYNASAAGTASLNLSPSSGSYTVGSTFTVRVTANSGADPVNTVAADFTYDKNVLQFVGPVDYAGSSYPIPAVETAGGGVIKIGRGILNGSVTGTSTIATVTFKVIGASNGTALTFSPSSDIAYTARGTESDIRRWNGQTNGANFKLSAPIVNKPTSPNPAPVTPKPAAPNTPSTGGSAGSTAGNSPNGGGTPAAGDDGGTQPGIETPGTAPTPAEVVAAAGEQPTTITPNFDQRFVAIKVVDDDNKIVEGATVTINGQTVKTDAKGIASFPGVAEGKQTVTVSYSGKTRTQAISVKPPTDSDKEVQAFDVNLAKSGVAATISPAVYGILVAVIGISVWLVLMPRRHRLLVNDSIAPPADMVVNGSHTGDETKIYQPVAPPPQSTDDPFAPTVIHPTEPPKDANNNGAPKA